MKAELNLVSASDFQHALVEHVRIEFGKQSEGDVARKQEHLLTAKGDNQALIAFDMVPQPLFHKISIFSPRLLKIISSRAIPYIYWQTARSSRND